MEFFWGEGGTVYYDFHLKVVLEGVETDVTSEIVGRHKEVIG